MKELSAPIGNIDLLLREDKTAFLSSRGTPYECRAAIDKWIDSLNPKSDCIILGNLQKLEKDVLDKLLARAIPVVLVLERTYPKEVPLAYAEALGDGRMCIVTQVDFELPWINNAGKAHDRNRYIIANAKKLVFGLLRPNGNIKKQLDNLIEFKELVFLNEYKTEYDSFR